MAVKHVKEYYNHVCNDYLEMKKEIQEWEEEAKTHMVDAERLQSLKDMIEPLKKNYERWSYMMFLLNQPVNKKKQEQYKKQYRRKLEKLAKNNSIESTLEENQEAIKKVKLDKASF